MQTKRARRENEHQRRKTQNPKLTKTQCLTSRIQMRMKRRRRKMETRRRRSPK